MQGRDSHRADESEVGDEGGDVEAGVHLVTEICDDDYRSMFWPCKELEEGDDRKPEH